MPKNPCLSLFGNMIRRDMLLFEKYCKVNHLHVELLLGFFVLLSLTDQYFNHSCINLILEGESSSGKSYCISTVLCDFIAIEGLVKKKNMTTDKVMSTNHMENGFLIYYDEIPESFLLKANNPKLSVLKSVLQDGEARTQRYLNGGMVETVYMCKSCHIVNMNPSFVQLDDGIQSRVVPQFCPCRTRSDEKSYDGIPEIGKNEKFFYELKLVQFHSAMLNLLISLGLVADVDTSHAKTLFDIVRRDLNSAGFFVQERQKDGQRHSV